MNSSALSPGRRSLVPRASAPGCFTSPKGNFGLVGSVLLSILVCVAVGGCAAASASAPSHAPGGLARSTASAHVVQRQPPPGSCHARGSGLFSLPDPRCTPGAIDPEVTQADIATTICRTGYTETVRPPESVTEAEKRTSVRAYGDRRPLRYYEYDHLVALELGGAPKRSPQPVAGARHDPQGRARKPSAQARLRRRDNAGRRPACHRAQLGRRLPPLGVVNRRGVIHVAHRGWVAARLAIARRAELGAPLPAAWWICSNNSAFFATLPDAGESPSGILRWNRRLGHCTYSVALNSQIAIPSITSPSTAITPASSSPGTCHPHQVTPGSSA